MNFCTASDKVWESGLARVAAASQNNENTFFPNYAVCNFFLSHSVFVMLLSPPDGLHTGVWILLVGQAGQFHLAKRETRRHAREKMLQRKPHYH